MRAVFSFGYACNRRLLYYSMRPFSSSDQSIKLSFHKRPLPNSLVALSSVEGKQLFREALAEGGMESFFGLSEQFITQSEPSYCALSSLAMVLNALNYDPKRVWKGSWRWVSEDMLQCESSKMCRHSVAHVLSNGMDFNDFEMLGKCHGVSIQSFRAKNEESNNTFDGIEKFRHSVGNISASSQAESFIVVNFSRKYLDQTGSGHFSPIGGYHPSKDLVLVMDVARFKYPPFWVSLSRLWGSMQSQDIESGSSRGYFVISTSTSSTTAAAVAAAAAAQDVTSIIKDGEGHALESPIENINNESCNSSSCLASNCKDKSDTKPFDIKNCPVSMNETCQPGCGKNHHHHHHHHHHPHK